VAFYAPEAHNQTNTGRTRQAANQQRGRDQDDDEPPTPNSTPAGPQDHYTEGEQQGDNIQQQLQRELDMLRQAVATPSVPAGADAQYNQLHAQARRIISLLTTMARQVSEQETRTRMTNLIEAIGDSLIAANSNNAAIVAFADANQRLLTATVSLAESANAIAGRAV
jgi:predicted component of type VI protein secretion system